MPAPWSGSLNSAVRLWNGSRVGSLPRSCSGSHPCVQFVPSPSILGPAELAREGGSSFPRWDTCLLAPGLGAQGVSNEPKSIREVETSSSCCFWLGFISEAMAESTLLSTDLSNSASPLLEASGPQQRSLPAARSAGVGPGEQSHGGLRPQVRIRLAGRWTGPIVEAAQDNEKLGENQSGFL